MLLTAKNKKITCSVGKLFILWIERQAQDLPVEGHHWESRHMYSCGVVVKSGDGRSNRLGTSDKGLDEMMLFVAMEYAIATIFNCEISMQ